MKAKISTNAIAKLKPGDHISDTEIAGFRARRLPSGKVTFGYQYSAPQGTNRRPYIALGLLGVVTPEEARKAAKKWAGQRADNRDPAAEREVEQRIATKTVSVVFVDFYKIHVLGNGLRSADEIKSAFDRLVRGRIGDRSIYDLKRSEIIELLDNIAEHNGAPTADHVLAYLRKLFNWFSSRDDDFRSPIVRGMARTTLKDRKRDRVLSDDELRDLFKALDRITANEPGSAWPGFVRTLLYSSLRVAAVARAHRDEINSEGWLIPGERTKHGEPHLVPMTPTMQKLFGNRQGFLFSSTGGDKPISGFSKMKKLIDAEIAAIRKADGRKAMPPWVLHDLRRTARTLMSRAGVLSDFAERVLAHIISGVRATYDYHQYADDKYEAMEKLAAQIGRIINPAPDNVVQLGGKKRSSGSARGAARSIGRRVSR